MKLPATNWDLKTYIGSCHKESERCAEYPENSTKHLNNVANITVDIVSISQKKKQIKIEEDRDIPFYKNEENRSIIANETIEPKCKRKNWTKHEK